MLELHAVVARKNSKNVKTVAFEDYLSQQEKFYKRVAVFH